MMVPAGRLAEMYSAKWIVAIGVIGTAAINLITPLITMQSIVLITMSRVLLGMLQTGVFPAGYGMLFKWFPVRQRSFAYSMFMNGSAVGNFIANSMAGYLAEMSGWPAVFYASGAMAVVHFLLFSVLVTARPADSKFVSHGELKGINFDRKPEIKAKKPSVPWLSIFRSPAALGLMAYKFMNLSGFVLGAKFPAYLSEILHVPPGTVSRQRIAVII